MPYIGNDIVNLNDSEARGKAGDTRFLNRVFTPTERELIDRSADPDLAVWSLWAAKESALKVLRKRHERVSSVPGRYEVQAFSGSAMTAAIAGWVNTPAERIFFRTLAGPDFVHCIASESPPSLDFIQWGIDRISATGDIMPRRGISIAESHFVRRAATIGIAAHFGIACGDVTIRRDCRGADLLPPRAYLKEKPMPGDLSLSHDFPFVAYAFISGSGA